MAKKDPDYKKPQDPKSFGAFLKKRAPIYLGLIGLFLLFVYPAMTEKNLDSFLDKSFEGEEKIAFDMVMLYAGENGTGLTIKEVIEEKIKEKFNDQKIFDDDNTRLDVSVEKHQLKNSEIFTHEVEFSFYPKGNSDFDFNYEWIVNIETGKLTWSNTNSKNVVQLVEYAD